MSTMTPTFGTTLRRAFRVPLGFVAGILLAYGAAHAGILPAEMTWSDEPSQTQPAPHEPTRMERMVASGRCWTGEAPAEMQGVVPGHVWVNGQYRGERAVGKALEQIFEGTDHGLRIHAFCR